MNVLPVFFSGTVSVLDGKFRAVVQAAEAQGTVVFHPDRFAVFYFDGINRADFRTESAADAAAFQMKIGGLSGGSKCRIREGLHKVRDARHLMVSECFFADLFRHFFNLDVRFCVLRRHFFRIA